MPQITFDKKGFQIDGADSFLISGEFHYFRVPKTDWRRRMRLFREAGGNTLATYVPWLIHEPEEGKILFDDVPCRALTDFLKTAGEEGLQVVLRPGPYSYSELLNSGMPSWLVDHYDALMAKNIRGKTFHPDTISYLHPLFLKKVRPFYRAFAQTVKPFMAENGGPVCMLQVDNELGGVHIWRGSLDYNRETMGIGIPGGRYPRFLERKFGMVQELNRFYGTAFENFASVMPVEKVDGQDIFSCRRARDYYDFYCGTLAEFAALLKRWLLEDGLSGPFCHNSANPGMNSMFLETVEAMGEDFLLGSDHYYTLHHGWAQNNPTPRYALRVFCSNELMRLMGMPPTVLEMPGGSPSDTPPILKEDLLACYMCNLAMGMKGVNFYIYTGGPNVPGTGETCDIYDYNAHIRADGTKNDTYEALKDFGRFLSQNGWMQRASLVSGVRLGFEWEATRAKGLDLGNQPLTLSQSWDFLHDGILYGLFCSSHRPELQPLDRPLNTDKPLLIATPSAMSQKAQQNIIDFVTAGGHAVLIGAMPETDLDYTPCTLLKDFLGSPRLTSVTTQALVLEVPEFGSRIYNMHPVSGVEAAPDGACPIAFETRRGTCMGYRLEKGQGSITWLGLRFMTQTFEQVRFLEWLLETDGAAPLIASANRNVMTTLWENGKGRKTLFVMNLYSSPQETEITLYPGSACARNLGRIRLGAMEVKILEL